MGSLTVTIQNLEIVAVDLENNVVLVKGNVPGPKEGLVLIRSAVKKPEMVRETEELNSYKPVIEINEVETTEEVTEDASENSEQEV